MKKVCFPFLLSCILFWWAAPPAYASHNMGVDISYTCLSPCTTRVNLKAYRDCTGITLFLAQPSWLAVTPGCMQPTVVSAWTPPVIIEVSPLCPGSVTSCTNPNASIHGVEEYTWYADYDICSVPNCIYTLQWGDCCRNPAITSLANGGSQGITTNTTIHTGLSSCNSSPVYTNYPVFYMCEGTDYDVHQGAIDLDGDSLVFALGTCYQNPGTPVSYNTGFSQTAPLGPSWQVSVDAATGMLHMLAAPGNVEVAVMCISVTEYRNGVVIGTTQRDIQITVMNCAGNHNPHLDAVTNLTGGAMAVGDVVYVSPLSTFCFELGSSDADTGQGLRLFWDDNLTTATFTDANNGAVSDTITGTSGNPPAGRFCWTAPVAGSYAFLFRIEDDNCPVYGFNERLITVHVGGPCAGSTAMASLGPCPSVNFSAVPCLSGNITFSWSGAGGFQSTLQHPTYTYNQTGSYPWQLIISNGLVADTIIDTVVVGATIPNAALITGSNLLDPCFGWIYDTLDAGVFDTYLWNTGETTRKIEVAMGGQYAVTATAANGCALQDQASVAWPAPSIYGIVTTNLGAALQNQKVYLIEHDTTQQALWAIDSAMTDHNGYYFFCNVTDTLVFLKAAPNALDYPTQLPTYADATLFWNSALAFTGVLQAPFRHDFATLYGANPGGPGFIGGFIAQGANKQSAVGDPVPNVRIYLRNHATGDYLGYRDSDAAGYFAFPNIPLGTYDIVPDRPLVSTTNVPLIALDAQQPLRDSLQFELHHVWLELMAPVVGVGGTQSSIAAQFAALPNPFAVSSHIAITLPTNAMVVLDVYDVMGKRVEAVYAGALRKGVHSFEVGRNLPAGIYFVRLRSNGVEQVVKVMKNE